MLANVIPPLCDYIMIFHLVTLLHPRWPLAAIVSASTASLSMTTTTLSPVTGQHSKPLHALQVLISSTCQVLLVPDAKLFRCRRQRVNGWVDERMSWWVDGWVDGRMGGWTDGWMDGRVDGWIHVWMNEWVDEWMDGWVNGRMVGWTDGQIGRWADGWMDGRMNEWTDGWMGGWVDSGREW